MKLIESKTLGTAAASIEFTSIPQDGTDLVVLLSLRSDTTDAGNGILVRLRPNSTTTNLTTRDLYGTGSSSGSDTGTVNYASYQVASDFTANTFSNTSIYIPNYASTTLAKSSSLHTVTENNATRALSGIVANLWNSTTAISSLLIIPQTGNFVTGSTASLYKITKGSDGIVTTSP